MRMLPAVLAALTVTLAGCGGTESGRAEPDTTSPSGTSTPSSTASSPTTTTTTTPTTSTATPPDEPVTRNVRDCFDGECRLAVTGPVDIRLNAKRFHYRTMSVISVSGQSVRYQLPYPSGGFDQTLYVGGSGAFGFRNNDSITVLVESAQGGRAVLTLIPGGPL